MIDQEKVKAFWDARAASYGSLDFESIVNLEQDPELLALKIRQETEKVFAYLDNLQGRTVLDLGAGVGQWSFRFQARGAEVEAVEYSEPLVRIGEEEARRRGVSGISFHLASAESFTTDRVFDVVFVSGLFVYLNDDQAERLVKKLPQYCHRDTRLLLRDGTGVLGRHEINDQPSAQLGAKYSAVYRTAQEYRELFEAHGFSLHRSEDMFEEGSPLNKFPETRLRVYEFRRAG